MRNITNFNSLFDFFCNSVKKDIGITKKEIADKLNTSQTMVSRWCKDTTPNLDMLKKIYYFIEYLAVTYGKETISISTSTSMKLLLENVREQITEKESFILQKYDHQNLDDREKKYFTKNLNHLINFIKSIDFENEEVNRKYKSIIKRNKFEIQSDSDLRAWGAVFNTINNNPQTILADALGVSVSQISKWKNGKDSPDFESRKKINKLLFPISENLFFMKEYDTIDFLRLIDEMTKVLFTIDHFEKDYRDELLETLRVVHDYNNCSDKLESLLILKQDDIIDIYCEYYYDFTFMLLASAYLRINDNLDSFLLELKTKIQSFEARFENVNEKQLFSKKSVIKRLRYMSEKIFDCRRYLKQTPKIVWNDYNLLTFISLYHKKYFDDFLNNKWDHIQNELEFPKCFATDNLTQYFDNEGFNQFQSFITEYRKLTTLKNSGSLLDESPVMKFYKMRKNLSEDDVVQKLSENFDKIWSLIINFNAEAINVDDRVSFLNKTKFLKQHKKIYKDLISKYRYSAIIGFNSDYAETIQQLYDQISSIDFNNNPKKNRVSI